MRDLPERLLATIRKHESLCPGDRVAVAVSGGADSVALLFLLEELRGELGIVLSVAHVNHKLRGTESDGDEAFTTGLAARLGLEFDAAIAPIEAGASASRTRAESQTWRRPHEKVAMNSSVALANAAAFKKSRLPTPSTIRRKQFFSASFAALESVVWPAFTRECRSGAVGQVASPKSSVHC